MRAKLINVFPGPGRDVGISKLFRDLGEPAELRQCAADIRPPSSNQITLAWHVAEFSYDRVKVRPQVFDGFPGIEPAIGIAEGVRNSSVSSKLRDLVE